MRKSIIGEKIFVFSKEIIKYYQLHIKEYREYKLVGQLLTSSTAIGANIGLDY